MTFSGLTLLTLLALSGNSPAPRSDTSEAARVAQLRAHYSAAEAELRAAPTEQLSPSQRQNRAAMLNALADYRERGDFGSVDLADELRPFRFVDDGGRRCAVAELLHASGHDDLVARISSTNNTAFVIELADRSELVAWLDEVGLSLEEAARIQGPARGGGWGRGRGSTGGSGGQPVTAGGRGAPASGSMQALLEADWWSWWEYAKVGYLGAERVVTNPALTEDGDRTRTESRRSSVTRRVLPILRASLAHGDATVRAAAAISFGRVAGDQAVPDLRALLDDPSRDVREAALLGLGATGSKEAVYLLLSIAHGKPLKGLDTWQDTDQVAILALALARTRGAAVGVAGMLPKGDHLIDEAVFLHGALAPSPRLKERARIDSALFNGRKRPNLQRRNDFADALAVEALREDEGDEVLAALLRASAERDLERRRSAVSTLGALHDARVNGPLRTAFETESDPVARGLALIAMANSPSAGTASFLSTILKRGRSLDRPWAALALGVLAREHSNGDAPAALRGALELERNRDNRRAIALALGIARDAKAVPLLIERIQEVRDKSSRAAYAYALGMIGNPTAAPILRAALEVEREALPRAELAQALATLQLDQDIPDLARSLAKANNPDAAVQSAAAFAFHGSLTAATSLVTTFEEANSPQARASTILALGLVLDPHPPFTIASELRDRNPFVIPDWFLRATQTTL